MIASVKHTLRCLFCKEVENLNFHSLIEDKLGWDTGDAPSLTSGLGDSQFTFSRHGLVVSLCLWFTL